MKHVRETGQETPFPHLDYCIYQIADLTTELLQ